MAQNHRGPGCVFNMIAAAAYTSGQVLVVAGQVGIVLEDAAIGDSFRWKNNEAWTFPKTTGEAWAVGDKIYYDETAEEMTTTVGTNIPAGRAYEAALTAATTGSVALQPFADQ